MPDEKTPGLTKSSPPRAPLTDIELLITLDRIQRDLKAIRDDLATAKANDERFAKMEHDFRVAKAMTIIAGTAALLALVNGVFGRISFRTSDQPPPSSNAERLGADRVPPTPSAPGH